MRKARVLMAVIALGLAVSVGHALADGPSAGFSGTRVAKIKFLDPKLNLVQLSDGMELRAPDRNMLTNLKVGEWVKVDFVSDGERAVINEIEAAQPDEIPAPTPTAVGGGSRPTVESVPERSGAATRRPGRPGGSPAAAR